MRTLPPWLVVTLTVALVVGAVVWVVLRLVRPFGRGGPTAPLPGPPPSREEGRGGEAAREGGASDAPGSSP